MAKNKQSNLIASVKVLHIDFTNKYIMNSEMREGDYSVLVNCQLLLSNVFSLALPSSIFLMKNRRNRLLRVSYIEQ